MKYCYNHVIGFAIENDLGNDLEFQNDGVRFAVCTREVMVGYSSEYRKEPFGQSFELAFPCETPDEVDRSFLYLVSNGATVVHEPQDMPWNQRTALFAVCGSGTVTFMNSSPKSIS
jgi:uncharacterized glyoxalase superfamily protein PhnB